VGQTTIARRDIKRYSLQGIRRGTLVGGQWPTKVWGYATQRCLSGRKDSGGPKVVSMLGKNKRAKHLICQGKSDR